MYNILLVDDEPLVIETFCELIDWKAHGFQIVSTATNGKEALDIIKTNEIDILVTDIKMPIMDGIELLKQATTINRQLLVIVLSGYDEYSLVRQSFKLGASDYFVKSISEPEQLLDTIKKAIEKRADENTDTDMKRAYFFNSIFPFLKTDTIESELNKHNIFVNSPYVVGMIKQNASSNDKTILSSNIKEYISEKKGYLIELSPSNYIVIVSNKSGTPNLNSNIAEINRMLGKQDLSYAFGVSDNHFKYSEMQHAYTEAVIALKHLFAYPANHMMHYSQMSVSGEYKSKDFSNDVKQITANIRKLDFDISKQLIDNLIEKMKVDKIISKQTAMEIFKNITDDAAQYLDEKNIDLSSLSFFEGYNDKMNQMMSIDELQVYYTALIGQLIDYMKNAEGAIFDNTILKVKQYIQENISAKITLNDVSKTIGISPKYLSDLFNNQVKENFSTYLNNERMKLAKNLLVSTDLKIYEIADKCGFSNAEYFNRVFKKHMKISPKSYRMNASTKS